LAGNLLEVKQQFKNHLFEIEIEGCFSNSCMELPFLFTLISSHKKGQNTILTMQGTKETHPNDLLQYFIQKTTIISFKEIFPSMNEIFIKQVNKSNDNLQHE